MSALLALADAATTILSDEEGGDVVRSSPTSAEAASSKTHHSNESSITHHVSNPPEVNPSLERSTLRRPAKKRVVPPEALVQTCPNIIDARPHHDPHAHEMVKALVPHARPNFYALAHHPPYQPVQLHDDPRSAPPMPLSMLPKKKRKKKEERYTDLQGQYVATSWYFNESTFPVTLMAIMESQGNLPCITFLSDNKRFVIVDPYRLEKEIFPKHFDLRKPTLEEFSEMLKLWGFEKTVDKLFPNVAVYKHDQFMKGDWEKCLKIEMPLGSLEKLTKIQVQSAKADATRTPSPVESPRKRPRRGNGVPLPPAELVAGYSPGSDKSPTLAPSMASIPRRITQEMVPSIGQPSFGQGAANAQSLFLSRLGQNHVQSMLLGQPSNPQQQQQSLVHKNPYVGRRISFDTNTLAQRFQYPRPLPALASKTIDAATDSMHAMNQGDRSDAPAPSGLSRRITVDLGSLPCNKLSSAQLDAMTEQFLARSNARLKSRPAGIMGPANVPVRSPFQSPPLPIGNTIGVHPVNLQLQAILAARQTLDNTRRVSMLGATQY